MRYSIGDLARRTGLTIKAVRFYSDHGLVPPSGRNTAGHRRYDDAALARLDLVRTLRELGLGLAVIRRIVDGEAIVADVAARHAEALETEIRVLRLRQAVWTAVAARGSTTEETRLVHELARLSEMECVADFLAEALGDRPELAGIARTLTPELPEDPSPGQLDAWIELAGLTRDADFRAAVRRLADQHEGGLRRDLADAVRDAVTPALVAGIDPGSPQAAAIVDGLGRDPAELRNWLGVVHDPRRERYLELLAVINGWAAPESLTPVLAWLTAAVAS
ncbi:MerR family transcriptional regulator [Amycolatopsis mediterranei S699]|uniref:MerR family transcriptional regulator n=2 Tax=Amycolatopsis mediterranei TaxID=33910 RepID=A0A0H3DLS5_AMYMU|nr:MerR family transcriptional regulator [Amycolatopsis mediterranei]ADJ50659.1 MerR family transcriptional regulator [Amycolatopsis mediterranei U32]AEK47667.1 MerR family transcriptional regulator [Amycolatopsis mediterranei S699]AFO82365.1 MerR family transcriptional regulator [Amycolatopsis mediterranei S699]AGT89494.1 MerR family transcriptional regulator [Amycolatopsis mediterranei RB]KDO12348.1 MerR family transcriptional regulator [Amycolatopsis mediterranei]